MKKIKTYVAFTEDLKIYTCEAYSKKQMRAAGMNMKLDWTPFEDSEKAEIFIKCLGEGYEYTNATNVTQFKY